MAAEYDTTRDSGIMADIEAMLMTLPAPGRDHRLAEDLARQQGAAHEVEVEDALPAGQRHLAEIAAGLASSPPACCRRPR